MSIRPFAPDAGAYVAHLDAGERAVVRDVLDHVVALLGGIDAVQAGPLPMFGAEPVAPPEDPALRRLLPDASRADPELAAEFRRLTEGDLRGSKVANLLVLRDALAGPGPDVVVPIAEAPAVAAALTDLRLVVAERIGIRTEADAEALAIALALAAQDDRADVPDDVLVLAAVNDLIGLLQDSLVELMLDALPDEVPDEVPDEAPDEADPDGPEQRPSAR